jgi:transcription initiation factor TFIIB
MSQSSAIDSYKVDYPTIEENKLPALACEAARGSSWDSPLPIDNMNDDELIDYFDSINYYGTIEIPVNKESTNKITCISCKTTNDVIEDAERGYTVCSNCGLVLNEMLDSNPEWKSYTDSDKPDSSRCSYTASFFLPQSSMGTMIGGYPGSYSRVKTLHMWSSMPHRERTLNYSLKEIQYKCKRGKIPKCVEDEAKILYKYISECKYTKRNHRSGTPTNPDKYIILKGATKNSLIAACIFHSSKKNGHTVSLKELTTICEITSYDVTRGRKLFLKLMKYMKMKYTINQSKPEHFVQRFGKYLSIPQEYIDKAITIVQNAQQLHLASTHTPPSLAASSIVLMIRTNKLNIPMKVVVSKCDVSEPTIEKACNKMKEYIKILTNTDMTNRLVKLMEMENQKLKIPGALQSRYDDVIDSVEAELQNELEQLESEPDAIIKFNVLKDDIDDYISLISAQLYDSIEETNRMYKQLIHQ